MNELDLMHALDGADDDILLEAERFPMERRRPLLPRIGLIAALIALLSVTVYGVYSQIRLRFGEENSSYWFQDFEYEGLQYTKVVYEFDLEPVQIREQAVDFLEDMLEPCSRWISEGRRLYPVMNYYSHTFESLTHASNFFGVDFELPSIVLQGKVRNREVTLDAIPMYYPEELPLEEGSDITYDGELGGATLRCKIQSGDERFSGFTVFAYLGLTEEFCAVPYETFNFLALDAEGEPEIQEKRIGDQEFTILTFPDSPDRDVTVFYVRNGIAYRVMFFPAEDYTGDLYQLVEPCLKELG